MKRFFGYLRVFIYLSNPWRGQEIVVTRILKDKELKIDRNTWNEMLREQKSTLMSLRKTLASFDFQARNSNYSKGQEVQAKNYAAQSKQRASYLKLFSERCTFTKESDREVLQGLVNNFQELTSQLLESANWLEKSQHSKGFESE